LGLAGAAALAVRVLLLGLGVLPPPSLLPYPWLVNVGWLILFGLQHSGMARTRFKTGVGRLIPSRLERSLYVALSGLLLMGMSLTWQRVDGSPLWSAPLALGVVSLAGGMGLAWINLRFDHAGFFGLRQVWEPVPSPDELLVIGPYRYVRHPVM